MKFKSVLTTALLATTVLLAGPSAKAALTYSPGDLFIGFRATGGTGASQDYLVNVGQASLYNTGATGSFTVGDFGADLVAVFGSGWNTNRGEGNNVQWAVIGTTFSNAGDPTTFYVSKPVSSPTEFLGKSPSGQTATISSIQGLANGYLNSTANAVNSKGTVQSVSFGNSWDSFFQFPGTLDFNRFDEIEGNFVSGVGSSDATLGLYKVTSPNNSASTLQGTFSISSAGIVTYTTTPVPEPSAVALVGVAVAAFAIVARRRKAARV